MEYPELAIAGMLEGFDSKYLAILAGMNRADEISELRKYLKWSFEELNISEISKREASLIYAIAILDETLDGKREIVKGVYDIKNSALSNYDFYAESDKYCYDSIKFEVIFGLFNEYYDELDKFRPDKKYLEEIKVELLAELKKWKENLKTVYNNV
ncbi:hypothetical protein F7644_12170 [Tenacibaculum finnmarkense genomovar ulcerans]|nr:hypothetical protein [Tenacibaculum finnmarkense genomovar ulcerans]